MNIRANHTMHYLERIKDPSSAEPPRILMTKIGNSKELPARLGKGAGS
jgi:hypothetical protein